MPNVKISAAADAGTLLSSDMLPLARSGNTNAYHTTMSSVATFTNASLSSGAYGNVGRNLLHNPLMAIAQRGVGTFITVGYTLDRWALVANLDTGLSVSQQVASDAHRAATGDESMSNFVLVGTTGNAGAAAFTTFQQPIENVRRLSAKTVTVSFWAWAASGTPKLGVSLDLYFGTGGSPSARINGNGQSVTLSTTATRYTMTFSLASIAGMTLGTNNDHSTYMIFWLSSGATNATRSGNVGVQTASIALWGVQLEVGSVATPLDYGGSPADQLRQCQRYYTVLNRVQWGGYAANSGVALYTPLPLPVSMRAAPTIAFVNPSYTNASGVTATQSQPTAVSIYATSSAAGQIWALTDVTASADL